MIKGVKSGTQKERAWIPEKSTAHFPPSSCPNSEPGKCEFHLERSCLFSFLTPHIFPESPVTLVFGKTLLLVSNTRCPAAPISLLGFSLFLSLLSPRSPSQASPGRSLCWVALFPRGLPAPLCQRSYTSTPRPPSLPRLRSSRTSPVSLSLSPEALCVAPHMPTWPLLLTDGFPLFQS